MEPQQTAAALTPSTSTQSGHWGSENRSEDKKGTRPKRTSARFRGGSCEAAPDTQSPILPRRNPKEYHAEREASARQVKKALFEKLDALLPCVLKRSKREVIIDATRIIRNIKEGNTHIPIAENQEAFNERRATTLEQSRMNEEELAGKGTKVKHRLRAKHARKLFDESMRQLKNQLQPDTNKLKVVEVLESAIAFISQVKTAEQNEMADEARNVDVVSLDPEQTPTATPKMPEAFDVSSEMSGLPVDTSHLPAQPGFIATSFTATAFDTRPTNAEALQDLADQL